MKCQNIEVYEIVSCPQLQVLVNSCTCFHIVVFLFLDHLLSYDMSQGQQKGRVRGNNLELIDWIYDGDIMSQQLSNGLGQLTGQ